MKSLAIIARTLFPVDASERSMRPRRSGTSHSSLLSQVLAVGFAVTPLIIVIEAMAQTV